MCGISVAAIDVSKAKQVWSAKLAIARAAAFGDLDKPKRLQFSNRWTYAVPMDPVLNELIERHWKATVVCAPVMTEFNFNPSKNLMRCARQNSKSWRFRHLHEACDEYPFDFAALANLPSSGRSACRVNFL